MLGMNFQTSVRRTWYAPCLFGKVTNKQGYEKKNVMHDANVMFKKIKWKKEKKRKNGESFKYLE